MTSLTHPAIAGLPSHDARPPAALPETEGAVLLSDEPTVEILIKARDGDRDAAEALFQRSVPALKRWAHGRLPTAARNSLDTGDLVQETVLHVLRHLHAFEPRHVGAMQAYLRMSVVNRIRDEVRRLGRHPTRVEIPADLASDLPSPLEAAVQAQAYERYRAALAPLRIRDREIIVARVEAQWSFQEIARAFGMRTVDAARIAVRRALHRLAAQLKIEIGA